MPLNTRTIAIKFAVLAFFTVCVVGTVNGLPVETCTKRACWGASVVFIVSRLAVKVINMVLMQAMVADWVRKSEEKQESSDQ